MSTCGHCLAPFTGPMRDHTCEPGALASRKIRPLRTEPSRKKTSQSLAFALASSPRFTVTLAPELVLNLALVLELAGGRHQVGPYRARQAAIGQAARDYAAYRMAFWRGGGQAAADGDYRTTRKGVHGAYVAEGRWLLGLEISAERGLTMIEGGPGNWPNVMTEELETLRRWVARQIESAA